AYKPIPDEQLVFQYVLRGAALQLYTGLDELFKDNKSEILNEVRNACFSGLKIESTEDGFKARRLKVEPVNPSSFKELWRKIPDAATKAILSVINLDPGRVEVKLPPGW